MTEADVLNLAAQALTMTAKLAAPILVVSLVIGVVISLFQSVTQMQEMTITFVPKLAGVAIALVVAGSWMLQSLSSFTTELYSSIPRLLHG